MADSKGIDDLSYEAAEYTARLSGMTATPFKETPSQAASSAWVSNLSPEELAKLRELMNNRPPPIPYEPPMMPPTYVQPHGPCPSCGHCPACGRRNSLHPEPYRIWYGDSTGGPFRT